MGQPNIHVTPWTPSFTLGWSHSASSCSPKDTSLEVHLRFRSVHFENPSLYVDQSTAVLSQLLWSDKLCSNVSCTVSTLEPQLRVPNTNGVESNCTHQLYKTCSNLGRQMTPGFSVCREYAFALGPGEFCHRKNSANIENWEDDVKIKSVGFHARLWAPRAGMLSYWCS